MIGSGTMGTPALELLVLLALATLPAGGQGRGADPPGDTYYTVSYVEAAVPSRDSALAAFREYEAAIRATDGYLRFELFEEPNRIGHFALVEAWRSQAAFELAGTEIAEAMADRLEPIRVSNFDQRPYRALRVLPALGSGAEAVYVIAHVDVSPSPEVPVLLERHAENSRRDDGNLRFDVLQHTMRANHFTVIEAWENPEAYQAHVEAAHTREYRDALGPFLGSPLDERSYRAID